MSCNNCGKRGHPAYQCKMPITSNGIIAYRKHPETKAIEYLMIRRKDTLGLMDFIRGKYSVNNKYYIMNMISQMTIQERTMMLEHTFDEVWEKVWDKPVAPPGLSVNKSPSYEFGESRYKTEEMVSREKFNQLKSGVYMNKTPPNMFAQSCAPTYESDVDCALREFYEETGIKSRNMTFVVSNLAPYEEIFMGSNYKSYKHRYFLMYVDYNTSVAEKMTDVDKFEVSKVEWKSFNECLGAIRHYNLEKKRILSNINIVLTSCTTAFA